MSTTFLVRTITTRTSLDGTPTVTLIPTLRRTSILWPCYDCTVNLPYIRGTSETIARILQPYNIGVAHKPITTLRRLLTNVKDKVKPEDRLEGSIQDQMVRLPGFLH